MFWKFARFEWKLMRINRKNWLLTIFLLFFFLLYFIYYSEEFIPTLYDKKVGQSHSAYRVFDFLDIQRHDIPEVAEVYDRYTKVQSLLNMQVWHIGSGNDPEQYVEDGLEINRLLLEIHELGNSGIPEHLITPIEDILKEDALLRYIRDNDLPLDSDSFVTNESVMNALSMMSGLLFLVILLLSGNEILVYERRYPSILKGLPIPFMKKVTIKVLLHSLLIIGLLLGGFLLGYYYLSNRIESSSTSVPILMYQDGAFTAISTNQYLIYLFIGFGIVTLLILLLSVLLNMLFRNAALNVLIGLGIFILPDLVRQMGFQAKFLHPIKFIDMNKVLNGELAFQLDNMAIGYWNVIITLSIGCLILFLVIYLINKYTYHRTPKQVPLEKPF